MTRLPVAALATLTALLAAAAPARAATQSSTSSNWSGYVAAKNGVSFSKVSATWTVTPVDCANPATYSAAWVGLGGYRTTSKALEQTGTEADCSRSGTAHYSAWYELVPDAGHSLGLTVRPGDKISASVAVSGHQVTIRMRDKTRGTSVTKRLTATAVDTTSADWIVEAPALCDAGGANCSITELADFGTTRFAHASATTRAGYSGSVSDAHWSSVKIALRSGASGRPMPGFRRDQAAMSTGASATPSALNAAGDSFAVTYAAAA